MPPGIRDPHPTMCDPMRHAKGHSRPSVTGCVARGRGIIKRTASSQRGISMDSIRHDVQARRFLVAVDGHDAFLDYESDGPLMTITHTVVPPVIGGRGIGGELVRAAFEHARAAEWKVRAVCSYAATYARRHPELAPLLA